MLHYRKILRNAKYGEMTQGTIFNGAISRFYKDHSLYGVIISPRCDIVQKKVPHYYYLPIVHLEEWINIELPEIFLTRIEKEAHGNLRKVFEKCGISKNILKQYKADELLSIIEKLNKDSKNKEINKNRKEIDANLNKIKDIEQYNQKILKIEDLYSRYHKTRKQIISEITENATPHFYFIEHIENNNKTFFIIRMREINKLEPGLFEKIAHGIDSPLADDCIKNSDIKQTQTDMIIMPLYVIESPFLEHIIQQFIQQFSKIGVEDLCKEVKEEIIEHY